MNRFQLRAMGVLAGAAVTAMPMLASAGITLYEEGDKSLEIGGRLQPQYRLVDADSEGQGSDSGDDFFLRRMRFYIEGTLTKDIYGIWQVDFGGVSDDPEVKDAFINYSGLPAGEMLTTLDLISDDGNEPGWRCCCHIFLLIGACPLYFGSGPILK